MQFALGFGTGTQPVEIPDGNILDVLLPNPVERGLTGEEEVRRALAAPIGSPRLREIVRPGEKIAVVTSDVSRPMPTWKVMPALVERIGREFKLGGHKAAAIAMVRERADIYLVSEMEADFVERLFMRPFSSLSDAYRAAVAALGAEAGVIVMPYGGSTLPKLTGA